MRLWHMWLLVILAAPVTAAAAPPSVAFTVTSQHLIIVPVGLGHGSAHPFLLDTGGGLVVLSMPLIRNLHGKPAGEFTGFRLTGERMDLPLFTIPELRLGPVIERDALVAGWDGIAQFHLDGILSLSFFRQHPFTLDFRTNRLILETPASLNARKANGRVIAAQFDDQRGIGLDMFAPFQLDGHKALCEVDTGSQGYMFALRYMTMLGLNPDSPGVKRLQALSILGHHEQRYAAPVASIRLAGTQFSALGSNSALFEDLIYDCDVGMDFFANRVVTFDIGDRKLILSPR